jgi:hypothetical protein
MEGNKKIFRFADKAEFLSHHPSLSPPFHVISNKSNGVAAEGVAIDIQRALLQWTYGNGYGKRRSPGRQNHSALFLPPQ